MFTRQTVNKKTREASIEMIKWRPPNPEWIKVNLDGAANRHGDWSMAGGVFRDSSRIKVEMINEFLGSKPSMNLIKRVKEVSRQFEFVKF
ncbi:hypothetical protein Godav_011166 [Gossypium davidsonii]|uniref:RNase H type-1 domain-containing protein n=1 Tax=Gossypium davidsonii TaxID=34287 RepID=A0A7J8R9S3_GOSDV|nr:hypothetical protein [Gossypium davidsonii]